MYLRLGFCKTPCGRAACFGGNGRSLCSQDIAVGGAHLAAGLCTRYTLCPEPTGSAALPSRGQTP